MVKRTHRKVKSKTKRRKSRKRSDNRTFKRTVKRKATRQIGGSQLPQDTLFDLLGNTENIHVLHIIATECIKLLKEQHSMGHYFTCRRLARVFLGVDILTRLQGHGGVCAGAKLYLENVSGVGGGESHIQFLGGQTLCQVCRPFLTPIGPIRYAVMDSYAKFADDLSPDEQSAFTLAMGRVVELLPPRGATQAFVGGSLRKFERTMDKAIQSVIEKACGGELVTAKSIGRMLVQLDSNITEILCHPLCYSDISGTNVLAWADNVRLNLAAFIQSFKNKDHEQLDNLLRYSRIVKRKIASFCNGAGEYGEHYILDVPPGEFKLEGVGSLREQTALALLTNTINETYTPGAAMEAQEFIEKIGQDIVLEGAHNQAYRQLVIFLQRCFECIPEQYARQMAATEWDAEETASQTLEQKLGALNAAFVELQVEELDEGDPVRVEFLEEANKLLTEVKGIITPSTEEVESLKLVIRRYQGTLRHLFEFIDPKQIRVLDKFLASP